jgi:D-alanine transaminase
MALVHVGFEGDNSRMNISTPLPSTPCHLNGQTLPLNEAKISVLDRGFIFGDGIYEVAPVYRGKLFRFEQHMARMARSLAELRIPNPHSESAWRALIQDLLQQQAHSLGRTSADMDQIVYIQITRGVAPRDHAMPSGLTPTVFVMVNEMKPMTAKDRENGVACVSADDFRWEKAHIKSTSLLGAVFSRQISADVGALETIMFRHGFLSEAAASNVWVVKDGQVFGPPKNHLVLEGIRYGLMDEICAQQGIGFALRAIPRAEVFDADELLLSSATKEVLAITTLDGQAVGRGAHAGKPGPVYHRIFAAYQTAKKAAG